MGEFSIFPGPRDQLCLLWEGDFQKTAEVDKSGAGLAKEAAARELPGAALALLQLGSRIAGFEGFGLSLWK